MSGRGEAGANLEASRLRHLEAGDYILVTDSYHMAPVNTKADLQKQ